MNLYIHFLIKSASCLLAATTLIMASSCTWLEGDLLDLSGGEPADITIDQLYKRMSAATDPKGVYAKAKSYRLIQEVDKDGELPPFAWQTMAMQKQKEVRQPK